MTARCLVHIGYHKTATNWFQRSYYPAVTNRTYVHRKRVRAAFLDVHALEFSPDQAIAALEVGHTNGLILCEEELSVYLKSGAEVQLAQNSLETIKKLLLCLLITKNILFLQTKKTLKQLKIMGQEY